jgi:hypothetical protein
MSAAAPCLAPMEGQDPPDAGRKQRAAMRAGVCIEVGQGPPDDGAPLTCRRSARRDTPR